MAPRIPDTAKFAQNFLNPWPMVAGVDVMAQQSQVMLTAAEDVARYWQAMAASAMEMQAKMFSSCMRMVDSEALLHAGAAMGHPRAPGTGLRP